MIKFDEFIISMKIIGWGHMFMFFFIYVSFSSFRLSFGSVSFVGSPNLKSYPVLSRTRRSSSFS